MATVNYVISARVSLEAGASSMRWWGTFTVERGSGGAFEKARHAKIEEKYVLELQDKRRGEILITLVEKQAGVPKDYHFRGVSPLE